MRQTPFALLIQFDEFSATPKYMQLANSIIKAIENKKLQVDDMLPSINEVSFEFEISRDTVEKGYKYLKNLGIIGSVPSKGYYIKSVDLDNNINVFLLFNKLSPHKKIIYDSLVSALGDGAAIDFFIYNNDFNLFSKLIRRSLTAGYHYYIIIPHFFESSVNATEVLNTIPKEKLILLDRVVPGVTGSFSAVYEQFETDIYQALEKALPQLERYHTIKILFPEHSYFPEEIKTGFISFCRQYAFNYAIVPSLEQLHLQAGEVYINLTEDDLVGLVEKIIESKLKVGSDVGIISYNETPLKRIILNGITTISSNFELMGRETARIVQQQKTEQVPVPFALTLRASL